MEAKLIVVGGKANKGQVSIRLPTIIGRSREADLTVAHPMVSRQHCELYEANGILMLRDLGSLNGTFVAQKQITETILRPNEQFSVGPLTFRVEYEYVGPIVQSPGGGATETIDFQPEAGEAAAPSPGAAVAPGPAALAPIGTQAQALSPVDEGPKRLPAAPQTLSAIAPADGELPDFTTLAAADSPTPQAGQVYVAPPAGFPAPPAAAESRLEEVDLASAGEPVEEVAELELIAADDEPADIEPNVEPAAASPPTEDEAEALAEVQSQAARDALGAGAAPPAKKKRGWWPFGGGKSQADEPSGREDGRQPAAGGSPAAADGGLPARRAPVKPGPKVDFLPAAPGAQPEIAPHAAPAAPAEQPAQGPAPASPEDAALEDFLKGLH